MSKNRQHKWGKGYTINRDLANIADEKGQTWLHRACLLENFDEVKELIESGVKIDVQDEDGNTPLHFACMAGNCDIVGFLLDCGSDIGIKNKLDDLPLDYLTQDQIRQIESPVDEPNNYIQAEIKIASPSHPDFSKSLGNCSKSSGDYDETLSRDVYLSDFSRTSSEGSESASDGSKSFSSYSESSSEDSELSSNSMGSSSEDRKSSINYTEPLDNTIPADSYNDVMTFNYVKLIEGAEINFSDFD